jgi:hypothetical protein
LEIYQRIGSADATRLAAEINNPPLNLSSQLPEIAHTGVSEHRTSC